MVAGLVFLLVAVSQSSGTIELESIGACFCWKTSAFVDRSFEVGSLGLFEALVNCSNLRWFLIYIFNIF